MWIRLDNQWVSQVGNPGTLIVIQQTAVEDDGSFWMPDDRRVNAAGDWKVTVSTTEAAAQAGGGVAFVEGMVVHELP